MYARLVFTGLAITVFLSFSAARAQDAEPELDIRNGAAVSSMLESPPPLRAVPGQLIIKFKTAGTRGGIDAQLEGMGLSEHLGETSGGEYIYALPKTRVTTRSAEETDAQIRAAVAEMNKQDNVEYAQLNYLLHIVRTPNDAAYLVQWHYRNNGSGADEAPGGINLPRAWDRSVGAPAAIIAVIDTGILPNHPDIDGSPNLLAGYDMITDSFTANDGSGRDSDATDPGDAVAAGECGAGSPAEPDSWHGTHVAGTIGVGRSNNSVGVAGINWSSRVLPLRALGRCGGSIVDINDAIRWAAGLPVPNVPNNPNPANVINMSLGASAPCSASPATQSAIDDAVAAGVVIVVAAGNEASNASGSFPASCDNVITVAASDFNGDLVTRYSNFGAVVDIMAPGGDLGADEDNDGNRDGVLSTVQGGYAFYNGTSMAAPHVAGVAGLLVAQDATLTPQEIEDLLINNALPRTSAQCPEPCGAGLLNADIAVGVPVQPPPLKMTVSPLNFSLDEGDTATLTVTLTRGTAAAPGERVRFASIDAQIATITPAAATTDSSGRARASVTAVSRGNTRFVVSGAGQTQLAPVNVAIRVAPGLGLVAMLILVTLFAVVGMRRLSARPAR